MNIYFNKKLIGESEPDINAATKIMRNYLKDNSVKYVGDYWRWVGLKDNKTMIDFGSWTDFFYVDCSSEILFKRDDEKRNLREDKRTES